MEGSSRWFYLRMRSTKDVGDNKPPGDPSDNVEGFGAQKRSLDALFRRPQNLLDLTISPIAFLILFSGGRRHSAFWYRG